MNNGWSQAKIRLSFGWFIRVKGFTEEFVTTDIYCKQAVSDRWPNPLQKSKTKMEGLCVCKVDATEVEVSGLDMKKQQRKLILRVSEYVQICQEDYLGL